LGGATSLRSGWLSRVQASFPGGREAALRPVCRLQRRSVLFADLN